ncbi:hypothetical protein B0H21DRAFT_831198 [Amylocystis lapponica]|nr:hypothetical protein B0H21DRAFT_831198 [Amylocystis lapponica]
MPTEHEQPKKKHTRKGKGKTTKDPVGQQNRKNTAKGKGKPKPKPKPKPKWEPLINPHLREKVKMGKPRERPRRLGWGKQEVVYASWEDDGPWKYLSKVKAAFDNPPKFFVARGSVILQNDLRQGNLILPTTQVARITEEGEIIWKGSNEWKGVQKGKHELIINHNGRWMYTGSYRISFVNIVDKELFPFLPQKVKHSVYRMTMGAANDITREEIARLYHDGVLTVVKLYLRNVGTNAAVQDGLAHAMARCYRSRERRASKECWNFDEW